MHRSMRSIAAVVALLSVLAPGTMVGRRTQRSLIGDRRLKRPALADSMLDRFIVVPEHKLLFCYMEKVGCMNFNELFMQVRSKYDPAQGEGPPWYRNTPDVHSLTKADLEDILADDSWHKAVFWRSPVERFASAFRSKCEGVDDDGHMHCEAQFGVPEMPFLSAIAYFAHKDDLSAEAGQGQSNDTRDDEHFKRMGSFCGGLDHTLGYYDTVEELTEDTSHEKVSQLLRTVGIDPAGVNMFDSLFPPPHKMLMAWTPESWKPENLAGEESKHNTNTGSHLAQLFPPTQPWLMETIVHHYSSDYGLFGINVTAMLQRPAYVHEKWPLVDTVWSTGGESLPPKLGSSPLLSLRQLSL